ECDRLSHRWRRFGCSSASTGLSAPRPPAKGLRTCRSQSKITLRCGEGSLAIIDDRERRIDIRGKTMDLSLPTRSATGTPLVNPALIEHARQRRQSVENRVADHITAF